MKRLNDIRIAKQLGGGGISFSKRIWKPDRAGNKKRDLQNGPGAFCEMQCDELYIQVDTDESGF